VNGRVVRDMVRENRSERLKTGKRMFMMGNEAKMK